MKLSRGFKKRRQPTVDTYFEKKEVRLSTAYQSVIGSNCLEPSQEEDTQSELAGQSISSVDSSSVGVDGVDLPASVLD